MVTVEADQVRVESRLVGGQLDCPDCDGVLAPWGFARPRRVRGVGPLRPRRARCAGCLVTHVLLPVTVLLRRSDAARVIWAGLLARAAGQGHRTIGLLLGVPESTVRGWLRRMASRLESVRVHFVLVARRAGVDLAVPKALGSPWQDVIAAVAAATEAVTGRFGPAGVIGPVTAWQFAVASSGARLLSPGWPTGLLGAGSNTSCP
ncbi:MAG TPA: helix-turn-helix domain-containing protein [Mycobacterium sp.]